MLEVREYMKPELTQMLGSKSVQGIEGKLKRYDVDYDRIGKGEKARFIINKINDPFKVYCITELGYHGGADFDKLAYFMYYYFNDEEFMAMPDEVKEKRMTANEKPVSRGTIAKYTDKLVKLGLINKNTKNYIYYFAYKDQQTITTEEIYKKAWREYWLAIDDGMFSRDAIWDMRATYGGVARKQAIPDVNAFYLGQIDEIVSLALDHIEEEVSRKIK